MPFNPKSFIKTVIYNKAPIPSTINVPIMTFLRNGTIPDSVLIFIVSCKRNLSDIPSFLYIKTVTPVRAVMTPRPPICIRTKIIICPNKLQWVAVVTVVNPVTQVDVVAVKRALINGVDWSLAELMGKDNKKAPIKITTKKLNNNK